MKQNNYCNKAQNFNDHSLNIYTPQKHKDQYDIPFHTHTVQHTMYM